MSNNVLGILHLFGDEKPSPAKVVYKLHEGENFIGSSPFSDASFEYPEVDETHCKITLTRDGEFSIEDIGSKTGIFRTSDGNSRQKLKPNKEYELPPNKAFYLANKYKLLFMPKSQIGNLFMLYLSLLIDLI